MKKIRDFKSFPDEINFLREQHIDTDKKGGEHTHPLTYTQRHTTQGN